MKASGIYGIAAVVLGFVTFNSLAAVVWGVPVDFRHYLALTGSAVLFVAGIVGFFKPRNGQLVACAGIALLAPMWLTGPSWLVPHGPVNGSALWMIGVPIIALYFVAAATALFYPHRLRFGAVILVVLICISLSSAAVAAIRNVRRGEFARPTVSVIKLTRGEPRLEINSAVVPLVDDVVLDALRSAGITGRIGSGWSSVGDASARGHRLIVVLTSQLTAPQRLYYPKGPVAIYLFDGTGWRSIPDGIETYPAFVTVEPKERYTFISEQVSSGGRSESAALTW